MTVSGRKILLGSLLATGLGLLIALLLLHDSGTDRPTSPARKEEVPKDPGKGPAAPVSGKGGATEPAGSAVVGDAGAPRPEVSGVPIRKPYSVTVHLADADGRPLARTVALRWLNQGPRPAGRAETDAEGKHRWDLPDPGLYFVTIEGEGGSRRDSPAVELTAGEPHAEIRIRLGRFALSGILDAGGRDEKGEKSVPGQEPLEIRLASDRSTDDQRGGLADRIDGNGTFAIAEIPEGDYVLSVPAKFHFERIRIDRDLYHVVRLTRGRIEGRVFDKATGAGVPDVQVVLSAVTIDGADPAILPPNLSDRFSSREDGSFAFTALPAGRYRLFAFCPAYDPCIQETILPGPSDARHVDLAMKRKENR